MLKDTKSLGNNKAPACESRGFVHKSKKVRILTHLLTFKQKAPYKRFYYNKNNERRTLWKDLKI